MDSTGLKLCGAGEWLHEKHGAKVRRSWRKLYLGVDAGTGRIVASLLTTKDVDDGLQVGPLLDRVEEPLASLYPCGEARGIAACDFQRGVMVASPLADWPVDVRIRPRRRDLPRLPGQASSSTAAGRRGAGPGGTRYGRVRQPARPEGRRRSASPSRSGC